MFELVMMDKDGNETSIFYDPHKSTITDHDGKNIVEDISPKLFPEVFRVSPEKPGIKNPDNIKRLKIQLGLQCNYTCSYCLQRNQIEDASKASTRDAAMFLFHIKKWLKSQPNKIEFWGGEPLLYWNKIKILHQNLSQHFPGTDFSIITNGSLLDDEIIDYLCEHFSGVAISHDGPGQHLRGPDPLDDPDQYAMIKKLVDKHPSISINAVLSPASYDCAKIEKFIKDRLGPNVRVGYEGVVISYDGNDATTFFTPEQYQELSQSVFFACAKPLNEVPYTFYSKMSRFVDSIKHQRSSLALGQKCGMDRDDQLAVDLLGNVITCQNTGVAGKHKIGHVFDMESVKLNTAWHWSNRKECSTCPLLQLCAGSCMYNEGMAWYHSCNNEYAYNLGILAGALFHMSGLVLKEIRGDIYRPDPADYQ